MRSIKLAVLVIIASGCGDGASEMDQTWPNGESNLEPDARHSDSESTNSTPMEEAAKGKAESETTPAKSADSDPYPCSVRGLPDDDRQWRSTGYVIAPQRAHCYCWDGNFTPDSRVWVEIQPEEGGIKLPDPGICAESFGRRVRPGYSTTGGSEVAGEDFVFQAVARDGLRGVYAATISIYQLDEWNRPDYNVLLGRETVLYAAGVDYLINDETVSVDLGPL